MKHLRIYAVLCAVLLTGCYESIYKEIETVNDDRGEAVVVGTVPETFVETVTFTEHPTEAGTIYIENEAATGYAAAISDSIVYANRHLTSDDVNYDMETAYLSGDESKLNERDRKVLKEVKGIIKPLKNKSPYVIASTVHDVLTERVTYGFSDEQYTAYGALVDGVAVCQGYAYAYKLCMDLAGVDCITVGGTADSGEEITAHAWNMVRIGDKWYNVDVTWDDSVTDTDLGAWNHTYLFMDDASISVNHKADKLIQRYHNIGIIPKANDPGMAYLKHNGCWVTNEESFRDYVETQYKLGNNAFEVACEGFKPDLTFISGLAACSYIEQTLGKVNYYYLMLN